MLLQPINLIHLGDLFRFYVDVSKLPSVSLAYVDKFEDGLTHSERVDWEEVPMVLKEMLMESIANLKTMKHWRYKSLYWDYFTRKWEFILKSKTVQHYCEVVRCEQAVTVRRLKSSFSYARICERCKRKRWRVNNPLHYMYSELKRSAKRRGIYFDLHRGEFIEFCFSHNLYRDSSKFTKDSLTVDRIDPNLGYTLHNLQVITNLENVKKGNKERKQVVSPPSEDDPF